MVNILTLWLSLPMLSTTQLLAGKNTVRGIECLPNVGNRNLAADCSLDKFNNRAWSIPYLRINITTEM